MPDGIVLPVNPRIKNLTDRVFGKLTVASYAGVVAKSGRSFSTWKCRCECGTEKIIRAGSLLRGTSTTCGCGQAKFSKTTHGLSKSRLHNIWCAMNGRCNNPKHTAYHNYGGRGIKICERWESFKNFMADMGPLPSDRHEIDRIDNNGHYEPSNCRWVTRKINSRNTRVNRVIEHNGTKMTVVQWAEITGLPSRVIYQRLDREWTIEEALTTPVMIR